MSAARLGKKVLLIERSMKLGGLATLRPGESFRPRCVDGRGKQIIFGMAEELLRVSLRYGYGDVPEQPENGAIPEKISEQYRQRAAPHRETRRAHSSRAGISALARGGVLHTTAGVELLSDNYPCPGGLQPRTARESCGKL
ncbi:MAG: hypothetical protein ACLR23_25590 [Clostridia bacterium]